MINTRMSGLFLARLWAITIIVALLISSIPSAYLVAEAASTGIVVSSTSLTTTVGSQVNFKVTVEATGPKTGGTYISVSDNGAGGSFFDSNGQCNNTAPDSDNQFSIEANKNVCYSNATAGDYLVTVKLLDGSGGNQIGDAKVISVKVNEVVLITVDPKVDICHATQADNNLYSAVSADAKSIINRPNGHDYHIDGGLDDMGDIIPPFQYDFDGTGLLDYLGLNWEHVFSNGLTGEQVYNQGNCEGRPERQSADLIITKTVSTTTPEVGTTITYTISVKNDGPNEAKGVIVTDPLASGITYVSSSPMTPDQTSPLTWNIGTIGVGSSWETVVMVTVDSGTVGQTITNTSNVVGSITDPNSTNNSDSAEITPVTSTGSTTEVGTLVVEKKVIGIDVPDFTTFSFIIDGGATTTFKASGTNIFTLPVGNYTVVETETTGFDTTYSNCNNAIIAEGATTTCTVTNTKKSGPTPICTVELVSNTADFVIEKESFARTLSFVHSGWTAVISGAVWIWGDDPVINPEVSEIQTFRKQFGFVGTVVDAKLYVASDNYHSVILNSSLAGLSTTTNNFQLDTQDVYDVTSLVVQGNNELDIEVNNAGVIGSDSRSNPAGLLYKLVISGQPTSDTDCSIPYVPPVPEVNTYRIQGYAWHDDNSNTEWDGRSSDEQTILIETTLAGWTINISNGTTSYATTTDETGLYYFDVPAGTWTVTEVVPVGWKLTTAESHVVTVPDVPVFTLLDTIRDFFINTAHAALERPYYDNNNFGNDTVDVIVTTSSSGGSSSGGGGGSSGGGTLAVPQVLGVTNTPQPTPLVLGEQVSVVPIGAPNTGRGGASPREFSYSLLQLLLSRRRVEGV